MLVAGGVASRVTSEAPEAQRPCSKYGGPGGLSPLHALCANFLLGQHLTIRTQTRRRSDLSTVLVALTGPLASLHWPPRGVLGRKSRSPPAVPSPWRTTMGVGCPLAPPRQQV